MYRYRYRRRFRRRREVSPAALVTAGVLVLVAAAQGHHHPHAAAGRPGEIAAAPGPAAARAVAFARAQLGKPYQWGATGPGCYDCSGLAWAAWEDAGLSWARTTAAGMWASEPHVADPADGDLVFFAGGDGTPTAPGHVGIVVAPHLMIDAYATGWPVEYDSFGLPSSRGGLTDVVGFTDPCRDPLKMSFSQKDVRGLSFWTFH